MEAAWRGVAAVGVVTAVAALLPASGASGPWLALIFGVTAAAIVLVRWLEGGLGSLARAVRSPWLLLGIGLALTSAGPLVEYHLRGAAVLTSPIAAALSVLSGVFVIAGLLGLLRLRAPEQAFALLVGESLFPLAGAFLVWVLALQLPTLGRLRPLVVTVGVGLAAADVCFVAVTALLCRFDDDQVPALRLATGAFVLLTAARVAQAIDVRLGGGIDPRWTSAAAVAAMGLWLAACVHPSAGAGVPAQRTSGVHLSDGRRLLIACLAVMAGPALIVEYARRGSIRQPMWMAGGAAVLLGLVTAYLLRLAGRASRLEQLAHRDELTGLATRSLFMERLDLALARGRRNGTGVAVLFVDLDRFKMINDSLGHASGNDVLRIASQRLHRLIGESGFIARMGGDEFTVFVPDLEKNAGLEQLCASLVAAFECPISTHRQEVVVTASIGAASFPEAGTDAETLVRNADAAMYKAKRRGRDTFELYRSDINSKSRDRLSLESRLHSAVDRDELRLHYQPKIALTDGSIVGMEALVRWEHPELGLLPPAAFIHLAEESDLIVRLDEWVLERACAQTREWELGGFGGFTVAVNLSARDFRHRRVEDMVASVLRRTGLAPEMLELELTETLALDDPERTRATLLDLKGMGVHCSIDDFGTGYSSLSLLATLPIDRLKIDKSFVDHLADGRQYVMVTGIIALAHGLNLEITAEGVETMPQLEFLQAHGCDVMQGFLFSKPLAPEQLERMLMLEHVANAPGRLQLVGATWDTQRPHIPGRGIRLPRLLPGSA